jgi:hypothetical protein
VDRDSEDASEIERADVEFRAKFETIRADDGDSLAVGVAGLAEPPDPPDTGPQGRRIVSAGGTG